MTEDTEAEEILNEIRARGCKYLAAEDAKEAQRKVPSIQVLMERIDDMDELLEQLEDENAKLRHQLQVAETRLLSETARAQDAMEHIAKGISIAPPAPIYLNVDKWELVAMDDPPKLGGDIDFKYENTGNGFEIIRAVFKGEDKADDDYERAMKVIT